MVFWRQPKNFGLVRMLLWDYSPKIFGMRVALCRMMAKGSFFFQFRSIPNFGPDSFWSWFWRRGPIFGDDLFWEANLQKSFLGNHPWKIDTQFTWFPRKKPSPNFSFSGGGKFIRKKTHPKPSGPKILASRSRSGFHPGDGIGLRASPNITPQPCWVHVDPIVLRGCSNLHPRWGPGAPACFRGGSGVFLGWKFGDVQNEDLLTWGDEQKLPRFF